MRCGFSSLSAKWRFSSPGSMRRSPTRPQLRQMLSPCFQSSTRAANQEQQPSASARLRGSEREREREREREGRVPHRVVVPEECECGTRECDVGKVSRALFWCWARRVRSSCGDETNEEREAQEASCTRSPSLLPFASSPSRSRSLFLVRTRTLPPSLSLSLSRTTNALSLLLSSSGDVAMYR